MNENFYEKYSCEEQEVVVLIQKIVGASPLDDKWNMLATTIGMVFCSDGKVDVKKGRLNWLVAEEERNSKKGWNRFQKGQICRIKVRKLLDAYAPKNIAPEEFNAWCLVEVMEQKAICPQLEEVWKEYSKPVVIRDEMLGTLTLNREFNMFEGSFQWKGADISLILEVDADDQSTWENTCTAARNMIAEMEKWDQNMRVFSAKELTSLANEWMEEDDEISAPITEEIFAERISLSELAFSFKDSFTAYYEDDDMFWGHAIEVCGSLEQGIESANIVG
jgi:hypothetical protein